ncbi:MAG: DUF814 domain-containing protein [Gemmatimonadetes bacterium]|jgi:predicted ribosome quality control (RQC) complex YloA/Tae2 family protein|nr:DUF814 domain-containing protein [Gemmatimonadota bacterium]MBT6143859.1 DUF814 domain-containing protein [Gemmatimonadota bacterium]MBT7859229.1 DUF814 domain-containing protein [Gemmatimonadota bacterium]
MRFDLPTLSALAQWLDAHLAEATITRIERNHQALQIQFDRCQWALQLSFGGTPSLLLSQPGVVEPSLDSMSRAERFLLGARCVGAHAATRDRYLWLRLQRPDRDGQATYGRLYLELIPPRFRVVLASERRGHALGIWQAVADPRPRKPGNPYEPPCSDRLLPGHDDGAQLPVGWHEEEFTRRYLIRRLAGASGPVVSLMCQHAGLGESSLASQVTPAQWQCLWEKATELYHRPSTDAWSWHDPHMQVSTIEPPQDLEPQRHESIGAALSFNVPAAPDAHRLRRERIGQQLRRHQTRLRKSRDAMQEDLTQAEEADRLEHHGSLLLAAAGQIEPGASVVELPDPFSGPGSIARIQLDPRQAPAQAAAGLLKLAQKYRRRTKVLPAKLLLMQAQVERMDDLLKQMAGDADVTDEEMDALEDEMGGRQQTTGRGQRAEPDERQGARPRRYRTTSGWTIWAGRNNRENDTLSHRLAAQNDYWFHAHGYAGSHVLLRRDGRKEEPDPRTLEEAAAVAAYWSKGRTARKVPVVYTLAKYVSKPRGGAPGLAVMKREKTIMVQPGLLPEDDDA